MKYDKEIKLLKNLLETVKSLKEASIELAEDDDLEELGYRQACDDFLSQMEFILNKYEIINKENDFYEKNVKLFDED